MNSELFIYLSEEDKKFLLNDIEENGYSKPSDLINMIRKNLNQDMDFTIVDADLIFIFDLRSNYKIFITKDEIMTREEVINKYNLTSFNLEPEQLFNNQKIEVIDNDFFIFDEENENENENKNNLKKLHNTKIYIGKNRWEDFIITFRFMRSLKFISSARIAITNSEKNKDSNYIDKIIDNVLDNNAFK